MFHVEYTEIEVVEVEYLQEQMATGEVRRCHAVLYMDLELGDCIKQALQHMLL